MDMFTQDQLEKYAQTLWWGLEKARPVPYKKGDSILLRYDMLALPLAEVVFDLLVKKGLNPIPRATLSPAMEVSFYGQASKDQLEYIHNGERETQGNLNGLISLIAPESLTHLSGINPNQMAITSIARKCLRDIMEKREQDADFAWTLCMYPTQALADSANISLEEYAEQIKNACFLNEDDPIACWEDIFNKAATVKDYLNSLDVDFFHIQSATTDLKVYRGEKRQWIGISGHNIPSFELLLSPDYKYTEGVYYADQPSFRSGNYVEGIRLVFKNGVATEISAKTGEAFVKNQLLMDEGAARLGEFSLTDKKFSKINIFMANTLFDENFGGNFGNCHVAVGASYADTYSGDQKELTKEKKEQLGFNSSALHWDLVNTEEKTVTAHLKNKEAILIYKDGEFVL